MSTTDGLLPLNPWDLPISDTSSIIDFNSLEDEDILAGVVEEEERPALPTQPNLLAPVYASPWDTPMIGDMSLKGPWNDGRRDSGSVTAPTTVDPSPRGSITSPATTFSSASPVSSSSRPPNMATAATQPTRQLRASTSRATTATRLDTFTTTTSSSTPASADSTVTIQPPSKATTSTAPTTTALSRSLARKKKRHSRVEREYRSRLADAFEKLRECVPPMPSRADDLSDNDLDEEEQQEGSQPPAAPTSKSEIMGGAVEYIAVLERRRDVMHARIAFLQREIDGMLEMRLQNCADCPVVSIPRYWAQAGDNVDVNTTLTATGDGSDVLMMGLGDESGETVV